MIAAFLQDGSARKAIQRPTFRYVAPFSLLAELLRHVAALSRRKGLTPEQGAVILEAILANIELQSAAAFAATYAAARTGAHAAQAWNDEDYVALAFSLHAPVWTYDKDFQRIKGITTVTTQDLLDSV